MEMKIKAVIFDLDGVIVSTDECHYQAWKKMSEEEGIPFDRTDNERLRGVSRMESLNIVLEKAAKPYQEDEKKELAERKNRYYKEKIQILTPRDILSGVMRNLEALRTQGIKLAIGSSSKNTIAILKQIGLQNYFDAVSDGNNIDVSKPNPEVFWKAAEMLGVENRNCMVVEDADAGIIAGKRAGMYTLSVKGAKGADFSFPSLENDDILKLLEKTEKNEEFLTK